MYDENVLWDPSQSQPLRISNVALHSHSKYEASKHLVGMQGTEGGFLGTGLDLQDRQVLDKPFHSFRYEK